jgi:hypothetical protein
MFMFARSVAWWTGEEDDLGVPGGGGQRRRQGE